MKSKNVLLLGNTSFTGSHIMHNIGSHFNFRSVGRDQTLADVRFDVQEDNVELLDEQFSWADVVINCFSNGNVDSCEENPADSKKINLDLPLELCRKQQEHNFHLIHFSSNAVYDGENPLYAESDSHLPVNIYGRLKSEADQFLLSNSDRCTVLRPITMYGQLLGQQRHNPFSFFLNQLKNDKDITAVNDVFVNMLHVDVLVECVNVVIEKEIYGEFNISGDDIVNRFEFVSLIKSFIPESKSNVTETDSSGFVTAARRPLDTSFDNAKMKNILGVYPTPLAESIAELVASTEREESIHGDKKQAA